MESSVGIQDQPTRVNKKLVDIDERHPVPDNAKYRRQHEDYRDEDSDYEDYEEHHHEHEHKHKHDHEEHHHEYKHKHDHAKYRRQQPADSDYESYEEHELEHEHKHADESSHFMESSEDVAEIIPVDFHPGRMHISPVDLKGSIHDTPLKSASPVMSPVASAFENTTFEDAQVMKDFSEIENDLPRDFHRVTSGFRTAPATIEKHIEAGRSQYGYGIKADRQVAKYLQNALHLKNIKYAETLLKMYDNNNLHHIEAPHHPAPSKPLPGHKRGLTSGSVSDELLHIDENFFGGDNFTLHSDSETSGSHDPSKWHEDPAMVAASWRKESVVEVYSKADNQWMPAVIIDEFDAQGDKWLGLDVSVHGEEHVYKEVKRFGHIEVRSLGVSSLEKESELSEQDPNHELLIMHGLVTNPRQSTAEQPHEQHEITISAHGAGSEIVNGRYIWQHKGMYAHKLHRNIELQHDMENHLWMFTCTSDHHNYYYASGNDGSDVPPIKGYTVLDGKENPPTLEIFTTDEHEDIESSSESDSEFIINNDFMELTFKLKAENVHDLGIEWSHTPNEKHLILWDVPAGSRGDSLGLRSQDILHTISGEPLHNSYEAFEMLENEEFPITCTVLRHRTVMAVVTIESCGIEELCGRYTIAGKHNDELLFVNNDKPEYQIFSGDHHNWIIGSFKDGRKEEYYMVNIDEEIPPTSHWRVCEHGVKPKPKIINTEEHLDIPAPPHITKVIPGDGRCTIEFDFDQSTLVPESAPRMKWWYRVEGRHCSQIGYENKITVTGLKNGEEYQFVVKAESQCIKTVSKLSDVVIPLKAPRAEWRDEGNFHGIRGGDSMITVYFNDSGMAQNNVRAEYAIEIENKTYPVQMSPHTIGDLYNGHEYEVTVIAKNSTGVSRSTPLKITPLLKPHEPTIVYPEEGEDSVMLNFQCLRYRDREIDASIVVRTDPQTELMEPTKKRPIEVKNLITGIPYRFQLVALNSTGITEGAWYSNSYTPMWKPTKPEIIRITPGHGTCGVFWECDYKCTPPFEPRYKLRTIPESVTLDVLPGDRHVLLEGLECGTEYRIIVEAINDNGSSESDPSEKFCPLEYPPTPHSLQVTKRKEIIKLKWECEDVEQPKYNAEYLVWAEPSIGHLVHTSRTQHNFTNLIDGVDYHFYVQTENGVGQSKPAVSELVSLHHKHLIIGHGQFGIEEMADHLDDTKVLTALFNLDISDIHITLRFQFVGKDASASAKADAHSKHERINDILGVYDGEIQSFESRSEVTIKNIINICRATLSDDPILAELSLEDLVTKYHDHVYEKKMHYRKNRSPKSPRGEESPEKMTDAEEYQGAKLDEVIAKCQRDDAFVNWVCLSFFSSSVSEDDIRLSAPNAYGAGSLPQVCEFVNRQRLSEAFILARVLGEDFLVHFATPSTPSRPQAIDKLTKSLSPFAKLVSISGTQSDLTTSLILSGIGVDESKFFTALNIHQERFPDNTRKLDADTLIRTKMSQENLDRIIEDVKSKDSDLNWVLIDPADC